MACLLLAIFDCHVLIVSHFITDVLTFSSSFPWQMVTDSLRFAVIVGIVIIGYANGFYSLIHFGISGDELASMPFDYSYGSIVSNMCIWLAGQADLALLEPLSPTLQFGVSVLFWSYIVTAYFVLLNLLIAVYNTTYNRVLSNSVAEWLFIRLRTTLEFETKESIAGVRKYYDELVSRNNRRAVRSEQVVELNEDLRMRTPRSNVQGDGREDLRS